MTCRFSRPIAFIVNWLALPSSDCILQEKYKNKPWLLEDETGQSQYLGQLEGAQSATYYLLMLQGREFVAIPAGSWYT